MEPVKLILDTDMDTDCDDAGAMAVMHALADLGEVEILATVVSSLYPYSVPTVAAINKYYGRKFIPIGAPKGCGASIDRGSCYAEKIAREFPSPWKTNDDAPDAVDVYRRILADQPDDSVTIVTIGYMTNLSNLLRTDPDEYSPLDGKQLVARKVCRYVCMGGHYPRQTDPKKCGNFKPDPLSIIHVAREWPTTITFTGGGEFSASIPAGKGLSEQTPEHNPVRRIYELFLGGKSRDYHCSDHIAVLVAVRGTGKPWHLVRKGYNHIFENGTHEWKESPDDPRHEYVSTLASDVDTKDVAALIESLMVQAPHLAHESECQH